MAKQATLQRRLSKLEDEVARLRKELAELRASGNGATGQAATAERPWMRFAGTWDPDDPVIKDWEREVKRYRRMVEKDRSA